MSGLFDRIEAKTLGAEVSQAGEGPALLQPVPVAAFEGGNGIAWLEDEATRAQLPDGEAPTGPPDVAPKHTSLEIQTETPSKDAPILHEVTQRVDRTEVHREKVTERRDVLRDIPSGESPGKPAVAIPAQPHKPDQNPTQHTRSTPEETAPKTPPPVAQLQPATSRPAPKVFDAPPHQQQSRDQAPPRQKSPTVKLRIGAITVKAAPPSQAPNPPTPAPAQSAATAPARAAGGTLTSYLGWRR